MDGTTEPVVAVIGHPIAGNPSQFALERALSAMELEWRVLSFDVEPDKIAVALDGIEVLGICGVLIDSTLSQAASHWYRQHHRRDAVGEDAGGDDAGGKANPTGEADGGRSDSAAADGDADGGLRIDCLVRGDDMRMHGHHEQRDWIAEAIASHFKERDREIGGRLWLGDFDAAARVDRAAFPDDPSPLPPLPDEVADADLIVISDTDGQSVVLESDDWPRCDSETLVIDLTDGHPELPKIRALGYQVLSSPQRRIGTLLRCLQRWTGCKPSAEVIHDAIEEYLAV
jgi:hypothetical protein